jgi:integrase
MHALRHLYASVLLDAGESVKAVAEWLGHADPAFTLRVYAHLMPESPQRARRALDAMFGGLPGSDGPVTAQTGE